MKKLLSLAAIALMLIGSTAEAQSVLYAEDFDGTHGWTLNVSSGPNGADNNFWTVSSDEAAVAPPGCSTTGGSNRTLHVTRVFFPSGGLPMIRAVSADSCSVRKPACVQSRRRFRRWE